MPSVHAAGRRLLPLAMLWLGACSTMPPQEEQRAPLPLLAPSALGMNRSAVQIVRGAFGAREVTLQCVLEADAQHLAVVGLTAMGLRAFSFDYDGVKITAQASPMVPADFDAQRLLADIQLMYWPLEQWQAALRGSEWQIVEPAAGTRRLLRKGKLAAEVHYAGTDRWNGRGWIVNFEFGYSLAIEPQAPQ